VVRPTIADEADLSPDQFGVAFCPERTASGRALEDIRGAYPRVVGGVDEESTRIAELLYAELTANEVIPVADAATAECIKLFEGVYRDVNIALANELATFAEDLDVDVRAAIRVANTQPYCDLHSPGPGVGGHCIPYYPWFLMQGRSESARLLRTARLVNERMPAFTAERGLALLAARDRRPSESTALLLGVAYRPDVAEARMSPAVDIAAELSANGVSVYAVDPVLDDFPPIEATVVEQTAMGELDPDLVALVTPHAAFEGLDWSAFDDPVILDCHDALDETDVPHAVYTLGGG
jgi:UDP-N-acetyl-D-mannosaminuronic acid dehydrogenase